MNLRRGILLFLVVLSAAVAAWHWIRPYDWNAEPGAGMKVAFSRLERDYGIYWLDVHLKARGGSEHDLRKPVCLILPDGREIDPAQTTLEGTPDRPIEALSLKFLLESADLKGPLDLKINDGVLRIRDGSGTPDLQNQQVRSHPTSRW